MDHSQTIATYWLTATIVDSTTTGDWQNNREKNWMEKHHPWVWKTVNNIMKVSLEQK